MPADQAALLTRLGRRTLCDRRQLGGTADQRQLAGAKLALQHNIGLSGVVVVTVHQQVEA